MSHGDADTVATVGVDVEVLLVRRGVHRAFRSSSEVHHRHRWPLKAVLLCRRVRRLCQNPRIDLPRRNPTIRHPLDRGVVHRTVRLPTAPPQHLPSALPHRRISSRAQPRKMPAAIVQLLPSAPTSSRATLGPYLELRPVSHTLRSLGMPPRPRSAVTLVVACDRTHRPPSPVETPLCAALCSSSATKDLSSRGSGATFCKSPRNSSTTPRQIPVAMPKALSTSSSTSSASSRMPPLTTRAMVFRSVSKVGYTV
mmetsp:Transcript_34978/g.88027  ORF Transcript_34978/g.88027 Transcript_34978/m.88027 type:complete len:254 (-) Transcript_34978:861-1622(-)